MTFFICLAIILGGLGYWAYKHGKLTGELTAIKAYVAKLEGHAAAPVAVAPVSAATLPATTVVEKQSAIAQISKSLATLKSQAGVK
jgi:hypothetical protein